MSLFACSKCNVIENSATSRFHIAKWEKAEQLCSQCDPKVAQWHNHFPRRNYVDRNYQLCPDPRIAGNRIICPKPNGWDYCKHPKEESLKFNVHLHTITKKQGKPSEAAFFIVFDHILGMYVGPNNTSYSDPYIFLDRTDAELAKKDILDANKGKSPNKTVVQAIVLDEPDKDSNP